MTGWTHYPNQWAQATIKVNGVLPQDGVTREVELHLRSTDSSNSAKLLEIDFGYTGYIEVVVWNGAEGNFTVTSASGNAPHTPVTGDVINATIVGTTVSVYYNGVLNCSGDISASLPPATGNLGMGFLIRPGANHSDFGITSFAAGTL